MKRAEKVITKSELNWSVLATGFIGLIVFGIGGVLMLIYTNSTDFGVNGGHFFILFALYALYHLLKYPKIEITNSELIVRSFLGMKVQVFLREDIVSYNEIKKENAKFKNEAGYMKWKDLTLFFRNGNTYLIHSTSYNNYKELKNI